MFFSRKGGYKWTDRGDISSVDFDTGDFTADSAWHKLDLSSIIGTGIKLVAILISHNNATGVRQFMLRRHGFSDLRNIDSLFSRSIGHNDTDCLHVFTDVDGCIDYYAQSSTWTTLNFAVLRWRS